MLTVFFTELNLANDTKAKDATFGKEEECGSQFCLQRFFLLQVSVYKVGCFAVGVLLHLRDLLYLFSSSIICPPFINVSSVKGPAGRQLALNLDAFTDYRMRARLVHTTQQ